MCVLIIRLKLAIGVDPSTSNIGARPTNVTVFVRLVTIGGVDPRRTTDVHSTTTPATKTVPAGRSSVLRVKSANRSTRPTSSLRDRIARGPTTTVCLPRARLATFF
jgi:hypothetical protein